MKFDYEFIENNLDYLLIEIKSQPEVASYFPVESLDRKSVV